MTKLMCSVKPPWFSFHLPIWSAIAGFTAILVLATPFAETESAAGHREQLVPILGVKTGQKPMGTVAYLAVSFEERHDETGLIVHFKDTPGRFSRLAQTAVDQAIRRTARSLGLGTDSWTVELSVPYSGVTIYGESLSAMIALAVAALAQGEFISPDRAITGTITPDGRIGPVGSVPLKITAARDAHLQRVLVPEDRDPADGDYPLPFLMQITSVNSVRQAYTALTARAHD